MQPASIAQSAPSPAGAETAVDSLCRQVPTTSSCRADSATLGPERFARRFVPVGARIRLADFGPPSSSSEPTSCFPRSDDRRSFGVPRVMFLGRVQRRWLLRVPLSLPPRRVTPDSGSSLSRVADRQSGRAEQRGRRLDRTLRPDGRRHRRPSIGYPRAAAARENVSLSENGGKAPRAAARPEAVKLQSLAPTGA